MSSKQKAKSSAIKNDTKTLKNKKHKKTCFLNFYKKHKKHFYIYAVR